MPHNDKKTSPRIAIIGAGMAGISSAQTLRQHDLDVTLFEKSRGVGGRLATRRNEAGESFDHGAQYMTTRSSEFISFVSALQNDGAAARWQPHLVDAAAAHHPWFVGTPGMNALLKPLAQNLDVRTRVTITGLQRHRLGWQLLTADGTLPDTYEVVISTAPSVQTRALFAFDAAMQKLLDTVIMAPCWTLMITFAMPLDVAFDAHRFENGAVSWMARQASRPGRIDARHSWVVHASADWSAEHLELTPAQAAASMQQELSGAISQSLPDVSYAQAHRWRYAMTTQALGQPFLATDDHSLFAGGDWCLGASVECAYQSGNAIADAALKKLRA